MSNNLNLSVFLRMVFHIPLPLITGGNLTNDNYSLVCVAHSSKSWLLYTSWVLILIPLLKSPSLHALLSASTATLLTSWNPALLILHLRPLQTGPDPLLGFISNYPLFKYWLQRSCSLEYAMLPHFCSFWFQDIFTSKSNLSVTVKKTTKKTSLPTSRTPVLMFFFPLIFLLFVLSKSNGLAFLCYYTLLYFITFR